MQAAALLIKEMNKLKPDSADDDVRSEAEMKVRTAEGGIKAQLLNDMPRPPEVKCDEETLVTNKFEETEPTHAKEESLRVLMRSTALKIDDVLEDFTCLEDRERSRIVFWAELSRLDMAEEEEQNSGKTEEELKYFSIRRFKRVAMTKFASCVELLNEQQEHEGVASIVAQELMLEEHNAKAEEVKMSTKSKSKVDSKVWPYEVKSEVKSEVEKHGVTDLKIDKEVDFQIKEEKLNMEAEANLIHAAKDEAVEEVRTLRLSERGGSKIGKGEPEKEEHEAVGIMIDKEDGSGNAEAAGQDAD